MVQAPQLAKALRAKSEADHRLHLAQIELMKAIEKHLKENYHEPADGVFPAPRWKPGRN